MAPMLLKLCWKTIFRGEEFSILKDSILFDTTTQNGNYVFIGPGMLLDSTGIHRLLQFVERGNNAFISSTTIPFAVIKKIHPDECYYHWDDYETLRDTISKFILYDAELYTDSTFNFQYIHKNKVKYYNWRYAPGYEMCESFPKVYSLGGSRDSFFVNFIQMPYGEGQLLFHSTPIAFF